MAHPSSAGLWKSPLSAEPSRKPNQTEAKHAAAMPSLLYSCSQFLLARISIGHTLTRAKRCFCRAKARRPPGRGDRPHDRPGKLAADIGKNDRAFARFQLAEARRARRHRQNLAIKERRHRQAVNSHVVALRET